MLEECLDLCLSVQQTIERNLSFSNKEDNTSFKEFCSIMSQAGKLVLILHADTALATVEELLAWSDRELIPVVMIPSDGNTSRIERSRGQVSLCESVLSSLGTLAISCLALGLSDSEFIGKVLDWAVQLLNGNGITQVQSTVQVIAEAAAVSGMNSGENWEMLYQEKVPVSFAKLLSWVTSCGDKIEEDKDATLELKKGVSSIVITYARNKSQDEVSWEDLIEVMVAAVVALLKKKIVAIGEVMLPSSVVELGTINRIFLESILRHTGGKEAMSMALQNMLSELDSAEGLSADLGSILLICSVVKFDNTEELLNIIEKTISEQIDAEDIEGERISDRELLREVKAACKEARGRLGLVV